MSGMAQAIGAQEFAEHAAASPPSLLAAYVLRAANEYGDIAGNPAIDSHSGRPARCSEEASCSASARLLNGSLLMNCAMEKSGLIDRHSATSALAWSMSPSRAWHPAIIAAYRHERTRTWLRFDKAS